MNAMQYEMTVHLPPNSEVLGSVSSEAKSSECVCVCVCVCVQRSSALLLPWSKEEGEGGEQVAHLVLVF